MTGFGGFGDRLVELHEIFKKLEIEHVFVGAAVLPYLLDDDSLQVTRATVDIDITVGITGYGSSEELSRELRNVGFKDAGESMTGWIFNGYPVDVVPAGEVLRQVLNPWFTEALKETGHRYLKVADGYRVPIVHPVVALACKFYAYQARGANDPITSVDLEDIVTLLLGNQSLAEDVKLYPEVRLVGFLKEASAKMLRYDFFEYDLAAHLGPSDAEQGRLPELMGKFKILSGEWQAH